MAKLLREERYHRMHAGAWLDRDPQNREKAVQIAAGKDFFNQDPKIIRFVSLVQFCLA